MTNSVRASSTGEMPTYDLEKTPQAKHDEFPTSRIIGLSEDDVAFLDGFSDERRRKVLRKVA